jgi:hypothetical protein
MQPIESAACTVDVFCESVNFATEAEAEAHRYDHKKNAQQPDVAQKPQDCIHDYRFSVSGCWAQ